MSSGLAIGAQNVWQSCPLGGLPSPRVCSYGVDASPDDVWVEVTYAAEGEQYSKRVELADHNYCGQDITYLNVVREMSGEIVFKQSELISPCSVLRE